MKSLAKTIILFLVIALSLRASVVEAFKIPSSSMRPTLQEGDQILVNKLSYGLRLPFRATTVVNYREPKRGDVVVFTRPDDPRTPDDESDINIIKRVIGLPGDKVEVRGEQVYLNDEPYVEDRAHAVYTRQGGKNFSARIVRDGHVFLLGDNRDESKDSRFWDDPFLEISRIKGRAFVIYWSWPPSLRRIFTVID